MKFRKAKIKDVSEIMEVRNSVHENKLSNPNSITEKDCEDFLNSGGKGWICKLDGKLVGFSMLDVENKNVWALFVRPEYEGLGIGLRLHDTMINWHFERVEKNCGLEPHLEHEQKLFIKNAVGSWLECMAAMN